MDHLLKLLGFLMILQTVNAHGCGDDWVEYEGQCFRFVNTAATGDSARRQCHGIGGDLAQITNPDAFSDFIATIGQNGGNPHHFWQIRRQDNGCRILTWLIGGTPIIKSVPCNRGGIWFICEKSKVPDSPSVPDCPSPWFLVGRECFFTFAEQPGSRWKTWADARSHCKALAPHANGDLAEPNDMDDFIKHVAPKNPGLGWWWIGGSYKASERKWHWLNGTLISSNQWWENEPKSPDGINECLLLWIGTDTSDKEYGNLVSNDCSKKTTFFCERQ